MKELKTYSVKELEDEIYGVRGTPEREAYEGRAENAVECILIGSAIRAERKGQSMTQIELGRKMGVCRSVVSRLENGHDPLLFTIIRAMKALGMTKIQTNHSSIELH